MAISVADELAFLDSLNQQEEQARCDVEMDAGVAQDAPGDSEPGIKLEDDAEQLDAAARGAAIAKAVDPSAELDLLDSLAKEAGIGTKAENDSKGEFGLFCHAMVTTTC